MGTRVTRLKATGQQASQDYENRARTRCSVNMRLAKTDIVSFGEPVIPKGVDNVFIPYDIENFQYGLSFPIGAGVYPLTKGNRLNVDSNTINTHNTKMRNNGAKVHAAIEFTTTAGRIPYGSWSNSVTVANVSFINAAISFNNALLQNPNLDPTTDTGSYIKGIAILLANSDYDGVAINVTIPKLSVLRTAVKTASGGRLENTPPGYTFTLTDSYNLARLYVWTIRKLLDLMGDRQNKTYELTLIGEAGSFVFDNDIASTGHISTRSSTANPYVNDSEEQGTMPGELRSVFTSPGSYGELEGYTGIKEASNIVDRVILTSQNASVRYKRLSDLNETRTHANANSYYYEAMDELKDCLECVSDNVEIVFEPTIGFYQFTPSGLDLPFIEQQGDSSSKQTTIKTSFNQYGEAIDEQRSFPKEVNNALAILRSARRYVNTGLCINDIYKINYVSRGKLVGINSGNHPEYYSTPNKSFDWMLKAIKPRTPVRETSLFRWDASNGVFLYTAGNGDTVYNVAWDARVIKMANNQYTIMRDTTGGIF